MIKDVVVLETPDIHKTIDEINAETRMKIISKSSADILHKDEPSIQEKLEIIKALYGKKSEAAYNLDRHSMSRAEKIKTIEAEISSLSEDIEQIPKESEEYAQSLEDLREIAEKIKNLKEKSSKPSEKSLPTKLKFPKEHQYQEEEEFGGVTFHIDITSFENQRRITKLHNKITEFENILGDWEESAPVSKTLSDLLQQTYFLNENILEKIKEQARHLGNDLDTMLSNSSQIQASYDVVQIIERLYDDTFPHIKLSNTVPELLTKLKNFQSVFLQSIGVDKNLGSLEVSSQVLTGRVADSLDDLKEIRAGIKANKTSTENSISALNKKLTRI